MRIRNCTKCGDKIPHSKRIEGKRRCLKNRNFCTNCSPYKTKKDRNVVCRKCGKKIPSVIRIENSTKNIGNRKFCTVCSPYGLHNTKKDIDRKGRKGRYFEWHEDEKAIHRNYGKIARDNRKKILVDLSGGCCIKCGYSKCLRALSFHHRNPKEKLFELNKANLRKPWDTILKEHKKCDLVCVRCHCEIEDELLSSEP